MLHSKFELIATKIFRVTAILKISQFLKITLYYIAHAFFQKMAPKSPPIFIKFSNTYCLMLCIIFKLIPTKIFRIMAILKNEPFSEKYPVL